MRQLLSSKTIRELDKLIVLNYKVEGVKLDYTLQCCVNTNAYCTLYTYVINIIISSRCMCTFINLTKYPSSNTYTEYLRLLLIDSTWDFNLQN